DAVFGLDVDGLSVGIGEDAAHRRGDHAVAVGVTENHHAAAHHRKADEVPVVNPPPAHGRTIFPVIANLACGYTRHCALFIINHFTTNSPSDHQENNSC